jgi:thiol-disulfide isomerase/thioredoxin
MKLLRNRVRTYLVLTALMGGWSAVRAAEQAHPAVKTEAELLAALDNGLWIADGKPSEKQIYVLAAPWCGVCRSLYQRAGRYNDRVQFRWIEIEAKDQSAEDSVAEAATRRDVSVLQRIYETKEAPPRSDPGIRENAVRCNLAVERATEDILKRLARARGEDENGLPTLIWLTKDGVSISVGVPQRLDRLVNSVISRPEAAALRPRSLDFLNAQYRGDPLPNRPYFAKRDGVEVFGLPDSRSQLVFTMQKGTGFPAARRVSGGGEIWIELSIYTSGPGFFVRERDLSGGDRAR